MKVLNETYVAINKLDRLVNNISADNFIFFNDGKIPPRSILPMDSSHMKTCQNIVRAFDGTERRLMGRIEIPLLIGLNMHEVDFLVMNIKPSYNYLLGRPWIHSTGVVPSSLYQKLKLVIEGRLITIKVEEDIIASVTSDASYIWADDEAIKCSFRSLEFVNATFIVEGNNVPMLKISKTTRMHLQLTRTREIPPREGRGTYANGQTKPFWLKIKARCEVKKERVEEETRKEKSTTEWGRGQVGTNDLSPYIQNFSIKMNYSP
ncbi:RNA-directed DNA polymerase (Reverse transcriptase), Ribonuclease H-like protein [Gossypium australe]|uniref:RNA-directed DNA polymerase (Reverse transcriptase), Ribonuclease H-like protein n=1 Tax=Gossypium australe TaxID=47621 RepID=A0A5B6UXH9_9ROSI|nr:RNA-directed DNA polymerase (Reverse transcriptase), Ribonuclease H-like protein [Gossypium australe]